MIKQTTIRHFKGLSEFQANDPQRVTLLGGRNNVGKTSVLEALFLYFDRHNPEAFLRQYAWRNVPYVSLSPEAIWAPMFSMYDMEQPIEIAIRDEMDKLGRLTLRLNREYVRRIQPVRLPFPGMPGQIETLAKPTAGLSLDVTYQYDQQDEQRAHHLIEANKGMSLEIENLVVQPGPAVFLAATARLPPQEDSVRFGQLDVEGKQHHVVEFLRDTVEPRLQALSSIAVGEQTLIHAQLEGLPRKIPVAYMGDGTSRLLSIILVMTTTPNGCVFIDEIENGIHYSALPTLWNGIARAAVEFNCQVLATTHSADCLRAAVAGLVDELRDEFCYVRLDRLDDRIEGKTYSHAVLGAALERNWEVR